VDVINVDRFWFPRGEPIKVDEAGFLLDPEHDFLRHSNPSAVRLVSLRGEACLALLGEAGLGKSTVIEAECAALTSEGQNVVRVDLGQVGGDESLVCQVFGEPGWAAWRAGGVLTLFLDAFDECRESLRNVAQILLRELRKLGGTDRLRLRIACRPGVWPDLLDEGLGRLWTGGVRVYHLAPLRARDAEVISGANGVADPAAFLASVRQTDVGPLATSPLTLQLLIGIQKSGRAFPERRRGVYEQGCTALCTEYNPSRRASGLTGSLTPGDRLAIAGRGAALTILCGKVGVWTGPDPSRPGPEWLILGEAVGGHEPVDGRQVQVTEAAVRETVQHTALFGSAGGDRLVWTHRSIAEFLAARFLINHQVPQEQLRSLLWHPASPDRIVPQLLGVVGWLGPGGNVLRLVLQSDPQALFNMDLGEAGEADRADAVTALLRAAEAGSFSGHDLGPVQFRRLDYPGLADQLIRVLSDRSRFRHVRELAIEIGRTCCRTQVQDSLVAIALDATEELPIRCLAASTISRANDAAVRGRLRPLLDQPLTEDTEDDLKGYALRASWPEHLTAADLFQRLTPFKRESYLGGYWDFVHNRLMPGIKDGDLQPALHWVARLDLRDARRTRFGNLSAQLLLRAWDSANFSAISADLAQAVWGRIERHERGLARAHQEEGVERFASDDDRRRQLLAGLLPLIPTGTVSAVWSLLSFRPRLVRLADRPWLIQQLDAEQDPGRRGVIIEIILRLSNFDNDPDADALLAAGERHPDLQTRLEQWTTPAATTSPPGGTAQEVTDEADDEDEEASQPAAGERVRAHLDAFEAGAIDRWCPLTLDLTLGQESRVYGPMLPSDLTVLPGWQDADEATRGRLVAAAGTFLHQSSPRQEAWCDAGVRPAEHAIAGFKALRLLQRMARPAFDGLELAVWERWLPGLLMYPSSGDDDNERAQEELLALAYNKCPTDFLTWLRRAVLRENGQVDVWEERNLETGQISQRRQETPCRVVRRLRACWDERVASLLRSLLTDQTINATVHGNLLESLLRHGDPNTLQHARDMLGQGVPSELGPRQRLRLVMQVLLERAPAIGWPFLLDQANAHPDFCREVLVGYGDHPSEAAATLNAQGTERDMARAYVMVGSLFLQEELPSDGGFRAETGSMRMRHFRNELMRFLCARGTMAAVAALDEIAPSLPPGELRFARLEAERRALENTWAAPTPAELMGIVTDSRQRLIRTGEELLLVLQESLSRFEAGLQGESATAFTLWDERSAGVYRPKEEERFADVLKQHLDRDLRERGVVVHREVEIRVRLGTGGAAGERTDIHVDLVERHPAQDRPVRVRAIIEVKGCWHDHVNTAMETQLRDRYLADNDCQHGLYVVGWFLCPQWDTGDGRLGKARRYMPATIDEARTRYADQARNLSIDGVRLASSVINAALR
jgi:hypothetical protein